MRKIIFAAVCSLAPCLATGDVIGTNFGVGVWSLAPTGNGSYQGSEFDVEDDLQIDSSSDVYAWLAIEHPFPLIPNLRLRYSRISTDGSGTLSEDVTFAGVTYAATTDITSELQLTQFDGTAYYEVLDNWVNVDLGMTVKALDGSIMIRSDSDNNKKAFKAPIPMLYGNAQFDLPTTGLSVGAELNYIGYSGSSFTDYAVQIGYESDYHLGAHLGYRGEILKLDDVDDVTADINVKGLYADLFGHF